MAEDMVMRSVYLRPSEDADLRQLAHDLKVTKSDLIRSAISVKLLEWLQANDRERILRDLEHGRRDEAAIRSGRRARRRPPGESSRLADQGPGSGNRSPDAGETAASPSKQAPAAPETVKASDDALV